MNSIEEIRKSILIVRGQRVMIDADLAKIYGVSTKYLNQQVRRNLNRFPNDFMFQLTENEEESLRLQIATSNTGRGGRRYLCLGPFARSSPSPLWDYDNRRQIYNQLPRH